MKVKSLGGDPCTRDNCLEGIFSTSSVYLSLIFLINNIFIKDFRKEDTYTVYIAQILQSNFISLLIVHIGQKVKGAQMAEKLAGVLIISYSKNGFRYTVR